MQLHCRKYPMVGSSYVQMYPVITSKPNSSTEPLVAQPLWDEFFSFLKAKQRKRFPLACNAGVFEKARECETSHLGCGKQRKLGVCEMCSVIGVGPRKLPSDNLQKRLHCRMDFSYCSAVKLISKGSAKTRFHLVNSLNFADLLITYSSTKNYIQITVRITKLSQ